MSRQSRRSSKPGLYRYLSGLFAAVCALSAWGAPGGLPDPLAAGWNGKPVCERLHEDATQLVMRCTFASGVGQERHSYDAYFGYTLSGGRMRIEDENGVREVDVPTGSSFTSQGVSWHEVLNVGDTSSVFLIVEAK